MLENNSMFTNIQVHLCLHSICWSELAESPPDEAEGSAFSKENSLLLIDILFVASLQGSLT